MVGTPSITPKAEPQLLFAPSSIINRITQEQKSRSVVSKERLAKTANCIAIIANTN